MVAIQFLRVLVKIVLQILYFQTLQEGEENFESKLMIFDLVCSQFRMLAVLSQCLFIGKSRIRKLAMATHLSATVVMFMLFIQ
jgi:hypothetical protein